MEKRLFFNKDILFDLLEITGENITTQKEKDDIDKDTITFEKLFSFCKSRSVPISLLFSNEKTIKYHLDKLADKYEEKIPIDKNNIFFGTRGGNSKKNILYNSKNFKYIGGNASILIGY